MQVENTACYHFSTSGAAIAFAREHALKLVIDMGENLDGRIASDDWETTRYIACNPEADPPMHNSIVLWEAA